MGASSKTGVLGLLGLLGALIASMGLLGCAGSGGAGSGGAGSPTASGPEAGAVIHQVTPEHAATTRGTTPIAGNYARLTINGMGCPQCVTNIDEQLERQLGAKEVKVNLEGGLVTARFDRPPTPDQLNKAVDDAGLTLVRVEAGTAPMGW